MKSLFAALNGIAEKAKKGMITISECNQLMEQVIKDYEKQYYSKLFSGKIDSDTLNKVFYINLQKAYHRMYKLLFELTKGN
jgi:hypothetical protein